MPHPTDPPGLNVSGLRAWLEREHPELGGGRLAASVIAGGKSNLTYAVEGAAVPLIVRRPPLGHVLASAHDMRREHRVIAALHDTAVPVPVAIDLVDDTAADAVTGTVFFVMERSPGRTLTQHRQNDEFTRTGLRALSTALAEHLAELHAVDAVAVGLADFGHPDGYIDRQLSTWQRQLDASRSRETPMLDRLQAALHRDVPETHATGIVHGDYRLDNALVEGTGDAPRVSAILDWEMATLGDPLVDLGILSLYWNLAELPGAGRIVPSAVDVDAGYLTFDALVEAYARRSGRSIPDLHWYRAFAAYKLAVIVEGIHYRYRMGETVGEGFEHIGDLVEPLATAGMELI
ncbi:phosphotransferase family protein [Microbacterium protaetiae]|uniref:Phosphotransferase family protein n=1 Tax=Microbacterium protaetiae TaxID=2509458 RepID=A0A4P6EB83_9MICO|nr:phosphotransferase family protein [Microbacterium protaetiae]QAY59420.1 phosphotransferase family protein [Microbacterium protaetiae]